MSNNQDFYNSKKALSVTFSPFSPARWLRERTFIYFINKNAFSVNRLLDIGCGRSTLLKKIKKNITIDELFGSEYSDELVKINRELNPSISYTQWDLEGEKIPYEQNKFDIIVCQEVIEHLSTNSQKRLFKSINSILTKEGILVLSTPYKDDIINLKRPNENYHEFAIRFENQPVANHLFEKEVVDFATEAGFRKIELNVVGPAFKSRYLTIVLSLMLSILPQSIETYLVKKKFLIGRFQIFCFKKI